MADPAARSAARLAAAVALPAALVAGLVVYRVLGAHRGTPAPPAPRSSAARSAAPHSPAPVAMGAPPLAEHPATVCRALLSRLPAALRDRPRRPVTAGPEQNAAYGEPAITLACGGPRPSVDPTAFLPSLSGVCWLAVQGSTASTWTTVDREVPVTVTVPKTYDPPGQWVIEFSAAIGTAVPVSAARPSGCAASS
ncbi:MAG: hypothetical protein AUI10_05280 [Actinobacteria bacterium 13_2_20CM_2_72_6]|nr:MAG: hypothetical protein AUI10_05280 [Actinobacteria bacterium 13_2_20CM_2_72_6]